MAEEATKGDPQGTIELANTGFQPEKVKENLFAGSLLISPRSAKEYQRYDITHEGYFELGRYEYRTMFGLDGRFNRQISMSEYQHFRNFLLWVRKYDVYVNKYTATRMLCEAKELMGFDSIPIPESTYVYLENIGNFVVPTGERFVLDFEELQNNGRYPFLGDPQAPGFDQNAANLLMDYWLSSPPPYFTRYCVMDQVGNQALGTNFFQHNHDCFRDPESINNCWFACLPLEGMTLDRRQALPNYGLVAGNLNRWQVQSRDVHNWVTAMNYIGQKFHMHKGMPPSPDGSPAVGLRVNTHDRRIVDDCMIEYFAGYIATGRETALAISFKYRLFRMAREQQWPQPTQNLHFGQQQAQDDTTLEGSEILIRFDDQNACNTLNHQVLHILPQYTRTALGELMRRMTK